MRPAQLLGLAFIAAIITGVVTALSLGIAQRPSKPGMTEAAVNELQGRVVSNAIMMALIFAGIAFIVVLLLLSMMLLAVKPSEFDQSKPVARGTLLPESYGDAPATSAQAKPADSDDASGNATS